MKCVKYFITILLFAVVIVSCSKNHSIEIVDGVEFIKNKDVPANRSLKIDLKKEFEIDLNEMTFEAFINLEMDDNDNIYILTSRKKGEKNFIYKFDKNGKFIKAFGKNYFDPSAFGSLVNVKDTLFLFEPRYKKLLMFDHDGELFHEKKLDTSKTGYPHKFDYLSENAYVIERSLTSMSEGITEKGMSIYDGKFKFVTKFFAVKHENRSLIQYPTYFLKENIYLFKDKKHYLIEVLNDKGEKIREISKEYEKVKWTKKEIDDNVARYKKRFPKFDVPYDIARQMSIGLSDYKDVIINIFVDKNNRMWIQKYVEDYDKIYFDIFENGIYQNSIDLNVKIYNKLFFVNNMIFELKTQEGKLQVYSYD